jgi:hypothetical protein
MAVANLKGLARPDDIALAWARFLIEDIVEQREAKTRPVRPGVFVFTLDGAVPELPTSPLSFNPEDPASLDGILKDGAYAYLAVLPGLPVRRTEWSAQSVSQAKRQMLGLPPEVIEAGEFPWYLMAVFYSPSQKMTFCGAFDGERFTEVKCIHGSYGGLLADLFKMDN